MRWLNFVRPEKSMASSVGRVIGLSISSLSSSGATAAMLHELAVAIRTNAEPASKWAERERAHEGRVAFAVSSPLTVRIGQESCPLDVRWILTSYRDVRWIKPADSM